MQTSETINELAVALAKAQGEMAGAKRESINPFFAKSDSRKGAYADLSSVWDACRGPLTKYGLSIVQSPSADGARVSVDTLLLHTSGQWIRGAVSVTAKDDSPQSVGSAVTYLRRYALQSFVGVAPEDDDAETAQGRGASRKLLDVAPPPVPKGFEAWLDDLRAVADEGTVRLEQAWKGSRAEYRQHLTTADPKLWEAIKAKAARVLVSA
jgi:ERF superfamily protein